MLESAVVQIIVGLIGSFVVGLIVYVIKLDRSVRTLELKVSDQYVKRSDLGELKGELHLVKDVVYRIALKMDVPVFTEHYR